MFEGLTEPTEDTQETGRFQITDERSADWLLKKLADIDAEKERIRIFARTRTAELDSDAARLTHLFGEQLKTWAEQEAERRRRKSVTLPNGTLAFRTTPARLIVADPDAALKHAEIAAADTLNIVATLDKRHYLELAEAALHQTGELWPGVEKAEAQETFGIRFLKGKDVPVESPEGDG